MHRKAAIKKHTKKAPFQARSRNFKPAVKWRRKRFGSQSVVACILSRGRAVRNFQRRSERCQCRKPQRQHSPSPLLQRGRGGWVLGTPPGCRGRQEAAVITYLHGGKHLARLAQGVAGSPTAAAPPWGRILGGGVGGWSQHSLPTQQRCLNLQRAPDPVLPRQSPPPPPWQKTTPKPQRPTRSPPSPPTSSPWDRALQACQVLVQPPQPARGPPHQTPRIAPPKPA